MSRKRAQILPRNYGFLIRIYIGVDPETGKRIYHNEEVRTKSKTEANKITTALLHKLDQGELGTSSKKQTLQEYLEEWLDVAAKPKLEPSSFEDYRYLLQRYIYTSLGNAKLSKLEPRMIQKVYTDMLEKGLSARTIRYTHTVLRGALNQAVRWRMLSNNPAAFVDLPKKQKAEMNAMSQDEVEAFLGVAKDNRHYALFALMLGTGLRPGEALGLKWIDFDALKATLYIQRSYDPRHGFKAPKTKRSKRLVKLPMHLVTLLLEHKESLPFESEVVFPNLDGKPLYDRNVVRRHYTPCLEKAGLGRYVEVENETGETLEIFKPKFRFYDLRHTHATLLLKAGVHPKIVSERLGHSSITLTLDTYSHVLPGMQDEAAQKLNEMLFQEEEDDTEELDQKVIN